VAWRNLCHRKVAEVWYFSKVLQLTGKIISDMMYLAYEVPVLERQKNYLKRRKKKDQGRFAKMRAIGLLSAH
jgi:hypothetical protein